jgi:hypothetical protein
MCMFVKIASVFCWSKNSMLCVFLVICGLWISCLEFFWSCVLHVFSNIYGLSSMSRGVVKSPQLTKDIDFVDSQLELSTIRVAHN